MGWFFWSGLWLAQNAVICMSTPLDRDAAIQQALQNNPTFRGWRIQLESARAQLVGSRIFPNNPVLSGRGGPQISGNASTTTRLPALPTVEAEISWAIPIGGRWGQSQQWAVAQLMRMKQELKVRQLDLQLQVHRAWNRLLLAKINQHWQQKQLAFVERLAQFAQKRHQHGAATALDLQLTQISLLQARQTSIVATSRERIQHQKVALLLGWPARKTWQIRNTPLPPLPAPPTVNRLIQTTLAKHIRLMVANAAIVQAQAALALEQARAIPDLTFSLGYSFEDSAHILRGGISIPLPILWRNQGGIGRSRAMVQRAKQWFQRERQQIQSEIRQAHLRYRAALDLTRLFAQLQQTSVQQMQLTERGIQQGLFPVFQGWTVQQSALQSRLQSLRNLQEAHEAYLDLCLASGMLPHYASRRNP